MGSIEQLAKAEAVRHADIDDHVEVTEEETRTYIIELLNNPAQRNPKIWKLAGAGKDVKAPVVRFFEVPTAKRGRDWMLRLETVIAAANVQVFTEVHARPLLEIAERSGAEVEKATAGVAASRIIDAAPGLVDVDEIKSVKESRKNA